MKKHTPTQKIYLNEIDQQYPPLKFGEAMVKLTNIIGTKPNLTLLNKPTQKENGLRQFKDEKGVFYEMDGTLKKGYKIIAE